MLVASKAEISQLWIIILEGSITAAAVAVANQMMSYFPSDKIHCARSWIDQQLNDVENHSQFKKLFDSHIDKLTRQPFCPSAGQCLVCLGNFSGGVRPLDGCRQSPRRTIWILQDRSPIRSFAGIPFRAYDFPYSIQHDSQQDQSAQKRVSKIRVCFDIDQSVLNQNKNRSPQKDTRNGNASSVQARPSNDRYGKATDKPGITSFGSSRSD